MLTQSAPEDQHKKVDVLVKRWLKERQELIVLMLALNDEGLDRNGPSLSARVQSFCEVLMDYVSAGHFEVYDELLAEAEHRSSQHLVEGRGLLQKLQATTDAVIRFNDIFERPEDEEELVNLAHELSALGLALESRFEIEDRMITLLHEHEGAITAA